MAFFSVQQKAKQNSLGGVSAEFLHKYGCKACPLYNQPGLRHRDMQPTGSEDPDVYILAEAPGKDEDRLGIQLVGPSGKVLRFRIPEEWEDRLRWNNCVRTRPPNNRTPSPLEIEACRPSVEKDIEATKPKAIFGFGNVPLGWALKQGGITKWNGRRVPVKIGKHVCWFFPMLHPSYILRNRKFTPRSQNEYGSENEFVFAMDLKRAFAEVDDLPDPIVHTEEDAYKDVEIITGARGARDLNRLRELLKRAAKEKAVGYDYETNQLRPYNSSAKILSVGIATPNKAFSFAFEHSGAKWTDKEFLEVESMLYEFLDTARCTKLVHQLSFELEWTAIIFGKRLVRAGKWGDSLAQAYILDERIGKGRPGCHSLQFLGIQYFGLDVKAINKLDRRTLDDAPLDDVLNYNAIDAKYHRLLYMQQAKRLKREGLSKVYAQHVERVKTMVLTQVKGIPVDQKICRSLERKYNKRLDKIEAEIAANKTVRAFEKRAGHEFRPSSNQDVKFLVTKMLRKDVDKVDEDALLAIKHPVPKLILKWRKANKLLSTYVEPLRKGSPHLFQDGLLHPLTTTTKTKTWRTASEDVNYQNFPKHDKTAVEVRRQIRAPKGFKIVSFDYGQIQARNVAMESEDPALIKAFWDRYDIHLDWAKRIAKAHPRWVDGGIKAFKDPDVKRRFRNRAKNEFVFPSFFGAIPKSLGRYLGIPENTAERLSEEFWDMFGDIHKWHKRITNEYKKRGYVTGLTGFRRRAPITPNELINAPIQADEALIVTDAMTRLSKIDHEVFQANMEIHDDLTFIWPEKKVDEYAEVVIDQMLNVPFEWARIVPMVVDMSIGDDWADEKSVGTFASDTWKKANNAPSKKEELTGTWDDGAGWKGENR